MEINPAYITFEQARLLKEKGIKFNCDNNWEEGKRSTTPDIWKLNGYGEAATNYYPAPEQWQVVEELRINHSVWVEVYMDDDFTYGYLISQITTEGRKDYSLKRKFSKPQKAYSAAFDYILNNLI
jgi:hypothetical protein